MCRYGLHIAISIYLSLSLLPYKTTGILFSFLYIIHRCSVSVLYRVLQSISNHFSGELKRQRSGLDVEDKVITAHSFIRLSIQAIWASRNLFIASPSPILP